MKHGRKIAVIGLGYVGLPVAVSFARSGTLVVGFDIDEGRVAELKRGNDRTREVKADELRHDSLLFTGDPAALTQSTSSSTNPPYIRVPWKRTACPSSNRFPA